jgi:hypothetical protein
MQHGKKYFKKANKMVEIIRRQKLLIAVLNEKFDNIRLGNKR